MRFGFGLATVLFTLSLACGGTDAPSDPDPNPKADGAADTAEVSVDTAIDPDTGIEETIDPDTGLPDTGVRDTGPDILTCTGSQFEPNNSEGSALWLKEVTDCDGSGGSFSGTLGGSLDVDWWHYTGKDTFGCSVDPTASTKSGVRVCIFAACVAGATELKSCPKGTKATSPAGSVGCCSDVSGDVEVEFGCTLVGADDGADVYMRVDDTFTKVCRPYTVDYHF